MRADGKASVITRFACLSILILTFTLCGAVSASASVATGDTWTVEGGVHYLRSDSGELLKSWSAKEWQLWQKEVQAVGECMGLQEHCAAQEVNGETPIENVPKLIASDAQEGVQHAREEEKSINHEIQDTLDLAGEDAGTLPLELGASVISGMTLDSKESIVGVELGNGQDQLLDIPALGSTHVEEVLKEIDKKTGDRCGLDPRSEWWENEGEGYAMLRHPPGEYIENCDGLWWTGIQEFESGGPECTSYTNMAGVIDSPWIGSVVEELETYKISRKIGKDYCTLTIFEYYKYYTGECKFPRISEDKPLEVSSESACPPVGVPAPNEITSEIEKLNEERGLPARPKISGVTLPVTPPSQINERDLEEISEHQHGREAIESMFPHKSTEEKEIEAKDNESLGPGNPGEPDRRGCHVGKPVNCATGDETQAQTDLSVGGNGPPLQLTLTYNSLATFKQTTPGPFGYGWTGSYSAHLELTDEGKEAILYQDNGSAVVFAREEESWNAPVPLVQAKLADEGSGYVYTLPDQTALHFNSSGKLTSEVDGDGNTLTMSYNSKNQLESISDTAGRKITLAYNSEGEVESAKDPMGHTVKYTYESGNLVDVVLSGEEKARWKYKYNSEHELTSETDGREYTTTTEYDEAHQVISQTDGMSRKRAWKYATTESGSETTITEPNGSTTVEQFNEYGSPTSVTRASGTSVAATTKNEYNGSDELLATIDPNNHKTEYGYDSAGDRTSEKNADGDETKWTYDSKHDVETVTTPTGETTTIKREAHGNPETIERPAPGGKTQITKHKYASNGNLESVTSPLEQTWKYEYDSKGDRTAEVDPEGNKRTWEYNEDSQVTAEVSPRGNISGGKPESFKTKIERNAQGLPIKITDPLGHTTEYKYDGDDNVEAVTEGNKNKMKYTYDGDDELTKVEEPNKTVTETEYDADGQIVSQTNGNKHKTKYVRNAVEEATEEINTLGKKTFKEYDGAGNLVKATDPESHTRTYTYDPANRLTEVSYSTGKPSTIKYEYDKDGNRTNMTDGTGTTKYTYDQLSRLTETENGNKEVIKYEYNLGNQQTKITYPNKKEVTRAFDKDGRLEKLTDWLTHSTKFAYNEDSELKAVVFPSETKDEDKYTYNDADQMTEVKMDKGSEVLASLVYTRDGDGQVKKTTSKGLPGTEITEATYDENNRLTKYGSTEYKYDGDNNPTTEGSVTNTYNEGDELEKGTGVTYAYDERGDRTKRTPGTGPATTYGYDQAGELISVERPEKESVPKIEDSYAYNGEGLRTSQTISGTTTHLAWDMAEGTPLILSDGTNSYIYGPGGIPVEQINSAEKALYLHHDQAGSTHLLTGSSGTVEGKCSYSAYGTPTCEGTSTTPLGYDAQYTSTDTGLIYLRNRVYDPATAQFLSVDPLEAISGEPYSYAGDSPLTYGDSLGLLWTPLSGGAAGADAACGATFEIPGVDLGTCGAAGIASGAAALGAAVGVVTAVAGEEGGDEGEAELKEPEQENTDCTANQIAKGHAFEKHAGEFGAETPEEFEQTIRDALENATRSRELSNGRTAYYDEETNTVVIVDPSSPDGGTIFKPETGENYFGTLK